MAHDPADLRSRLGDVNSTPRWQDVLQQLLPESPEPQPAPPPPASDPSPAGDQSGRALALRVERARGSWVSLRVLSDDDGRWVTTGGTWQGLARDFGNEYRPAHKAALRQVLATRTNPHHQLLATLGIGELTVHMWAALGRAAEAGVALLDMDHNPVQLTSFSAGLRLRPDGDQVVLEPVLSPGGDLHRTLLGSPIHGALVDDGGQWRIGPFQPLPDPLVTNFLTHGSVRVPDGDLAELSGWISALEGHGTVEVDQRIELPEPARARLVISMSPGGDPGVAAVAHAEVRYGEHRETAWGDPAVHEGLLREVPEHLKTSGSLTPTQFSDLLDWLSGQDRVDHELASGLRPPRAASDAPVIELQLDGEADWFDLNVRVTVGEEEVPLPELLAALEADVEELILPSGTWFSLRDPALDDMRRLLLEAQHLSIEGPGRLRLRLEHATIWEELVELGLVTSQSAGWRHAVGQVLASDDLPVTGLPEGLTATLRPYQATGHAWLDLRWRSRLGGILADEMGLGKTLQALALLLGVKERGDANAPALVVAPASVLGTWASEAERFAPGLDVVVLTDTGRRRGTPVADAIREADLVVTSYTLLRLEADEYAALEFSTVLLDEAQFIKNRQSVTYKAVRRLQAHVKFAMTGTPLENNLMDLWSLLSVTSPGLFPDPRRFDEIYRRPIEAGDSEPLTRLLRRIRPLVLRRTKEQVASELPPKQEQMVRVDLAPGHRRLYEQHLTAVRREVLGLVSDMRANRFTILRSLTRLRQLSLAPQLVEPDSKAPATKLDLLVDMAAEIVAEGHRALVFSSFTTFLRMAEQRLAAAGLASVYLDGSTRDRSARIEEFRTGEDPLFLISLKAGGFGLTLTEADYVFILDPWWNPAAEAQAIDRAHRIGQTKNVMVYRLVAEGTIEEKVLALQQRKAALFSSLTDEDAAFSQSITADDLRELFSGS